MQVEGPNARIGDLSGYGAPDRTSRAGQEKRPAAHDSTADQGSGDRIEVSPEARLAMQNASQVKGASGEYEVRNDKVEQAKRFLASGMYNDRGVIEQTAEQITSALNLNV